MSPMENPEPQEYGTSKLTVEGTIAKVVREAVMDCMKVQHGSKVVFIRELVGENNYLDLEDDLQQQILRIGNKVTAEIIKRFRLEQR